MTFIIKLLAIIIMLPFATYFLLIIAAIGTAFIEAY